MTALDFPTNPSNNDVYDRYRFNATKGVWEQIPQPVLLDNLADVETVNVVDGDALVYDGTNWVNAVPDGGAGSLETTFLLMGA